MDNQWNSVFWDGLLEGFWLYSLVILLDLADVLADLVRWYQNRKKMGS